MIQVLNNFRDLGAHVNTSMSLNSATLNQRFKDVITIVTRLGWLPLDHAAKAHQVRSRCIPKAAYGAEASKPNEALQLNLTNSIKQVISNKCNLKSTDICFITSSAGPDLDPETIILINRAIMITRATAKRPKLLSVANEILDIYIAKDYNGTDYHKVMNGEAHTAPMPGKEGRDIWNCELRGHGPIAFSCSNYTRRVLP